MDGAAARSQKQGDQPTPADSSAEQTTNPVDPHEVGPDGLSRRDHDILSFERQWWKYAGAKEEAIKELFGLSATRYYQVLNALVDRPEALAADPMLVKRLRRLRASRQKARAARRLGFEIT
ncbi:DUF3263 domain-containing protein [Gordonia sp. Z-3]|jgi:hypothetical protein|uniref:DUF3263 domain-containing protein n=2 Tax=Gordonia TaxID=2053 RepID=A0A9X3I3M3_9ACTN|nr:MULTISPECIES: DUF3263 domain-containing protein [Gordonia]MAU81686.1 hypothetical protein [Gordonia sp. (in: high G+C Gram-positive bacteria)]MCF3941287.1 DUF3263 domain-containing protein [Gordonia tangerina]MCX2963778.1 DUF3263 domain-containing protein [Gordonia aquimaris]MED5800421.1 DUF3263 domain-containing protein [Gordonia sp. Z-3]